MKGLERQESTNYKLQKSNALRGSMMDHGSVKKGDFLTSYLDKFTMEHQIVPS